MAKPVGRIGGASRKRLKLDDREWEAIKRRLERAGHSNVRVGILASKGGTAKHGESGITLAELMAIHEYGSPKNNIPARRPLRKFIDRKKTPINKLMRKLSHSIITGGMEVEAALEILGAFAATEAKKTITTGRKLEPPLKPATIARKGSDRPLVDTGQLVNAISWELE